LIWEDLDIARYSRFSWKSRLLSLFEKWSSVHNNNSIKINERVLIEKSQRAFFILRTYEEISLRTKKMRKEPKLLRTGKRKALIRKRIRQTTKIKGLDITWAKQINKSRFFKPKFFFEKSVKLWKLEKIYYFQNNASHSQKDCPNS